MIPENRSVIEWIREITIGLKHRNLDINTRVSLSFYLEHSSESGAKKLAELLACEGFDTDIDAFQQHLNKWRCWANISIVPNTPNLSYLLHLLKDKAVEFDGQLEGWETNPYESGQELGQLIAKLENDWQEVMRRG